MAWSLPAYDSNSGTAAGTTGVTVTKPTGLTDDDILIAIAQSSDQLGGDWSCSGWTVLAGQQTTAGRDMNTTVLRKVITDASGEPANYTFTNSDTDTRNLSASIFIVRGGDTSTPEDATTQENAGTDSCTPDSPSITTTTDGALVICISCFNSATAYLTFSAPTDYTLLYDENTRQAAQHGVAYAEQASAGASGAETWQNSGDTGAEWHVYTLAMKPESGAAALSINVSDSVTVGESVSVSLPDALAVSVSESVTVGESVDVSIGAAGAFEIDVSDDVTVGENVSVELEDLAIYVSDSVTVGESTSVLLPDALTIDVSESVTVGESTTISLPDALVIDVTESVTVGESVNISVGVAGAFEISVSESVTVGESVSVTMDALTIDVTESVTVGESVAMSISDAGAFLIDVSDSVTVGESVTISPLLIEVDASDSVTVGESVTVAIEGVAFEINVSDSVTVGESVTLEVVTYTPSDRTFIVPEESRIFIVPEETREFDV